MIEMVRTISQPAVRFWMRHLFRGSRMCTSTRHFFGGSRKCTVTRTVCLTVIGISFVLITDDIFHSASESGGRLTGLGRSHASQHQPRETDDDAYHQLQTLLSWVDPRTRCHHQAKLGGRCFICKLGKDDFIGSSVDGLKPICLDFLRPNCSVLSFGINNDFSFDDAMEDLGCTVHAFDPTMGASFRKSPGIHFHSVGIGAEDNQLGGFPVASLGTLVRQIGLKPGIIDYMKMDVESSEWGMLEQQLATSGDLLRVKQLAIEFHLWRWSPTLTDGVGIQTDDADSVFVSGENARHFVAVLNSLKAAGFMLTHSVNALYCQKYEHGCLSYIYETVWVNTKIKMTGRHI